jgi:hypothetical protein
MATDPSTPTSGKPRPWLLVALGAAVVLALLTTFMTGKSATPVPRTSNPRTAARAKNVDNVQPGDLVVHLEALEEQKPAAESNDRNPFRFYVKPPPPPPPPSEGRGRGATTTTTTTIDPATLIQPITLKYIGLLEGVAGGNIAVFSDCRSTMRAREGEIIAGQYRLVKIGKESAVLEYADGRGRTTIRMSGQECVGK